MKLLLTTDNLGEVWAYSLELARGLGEHHIQVGLATMGCPLNPKEYEEVQACDHLTLFESDYKLEWMENSGNDLEEAGRWLLGVTEKFQPDVIHLNSYVPAALPWNAPVLVAGHWCVLSWWREVKKQFAPASWDQYRSQVRRGLQSADHVVASTQVRVKALNQFYGPLGNTSVIPNGIDSRGLRPNRKEPFIFTAGQLSDENKNIGILEKVSHRIPWPIYVAGDTPSPSGAKPEHYHLRFLGKLSSPYTAEWLNRASLFVLPARYEPFGLSVLKAGLAGCALVLGDIPALQEIWGDAALYVAPDDVDELKATLRRLISDDICRRIYADRAYLRAREFSSCRMAEEYLSVYHNLTREKQSAKLHAV
jgi:glycogen synthase